MMKVNTPRVSVIGSAKQGELQLPFSSVPPAPSLRHLFQLLVPARHAV